MRNRIGKALAVEFVFALFVFFMILLFPLVNLIGLTMGAVTQYLLTKECASSAGVSRDFPEALAAMESTANRIASSGLGNFAKMAPIGGFAGSGTDLYIVRTQISSGTPTTYGPNSPYAGVVDDNNLYEYQVRSTFDLGPFLNLSAVPFIGTVPGVGAPARLTLVAHQSVEFTEGLASGGSGGGGQGGGATGGGGQAGVLEAVSSVPPGTGGGTTMPNGYTYTADELKWWANHPNDDDWGDKPNPFK